MGQSLGHHRQVYFQHVIRGDIPFAYITGATEMSTIVRKGIYLYSSHQLLCFEQWLK